MPKTWKPFKIPEFFQDGKGPKRGQKVVKIELRAPQKSQNTLSLIGKTHMEKTNAQNLIKPVEYEDFRSRFCKTASKSIKKALGLSVELDAVSRLCKTPGNR